MDLWQFIEADHDNADELFRETLDAVPEAVEGRDKLFDQLRLLLEQHAMMEESVFYPALQRREELRDLVADALEEHRKMKEGLAALRTGDKDGADWTKGFKELQQLVEHHVRDEEEKIFPLARKSIDEREAKELLQRMEQAKLAMLR